MGRKEACAILEGRAQKHVLPFTQGKNGGRVQKIETMIFDVLVPEMKNELFVCLQ